jgi:hypothetical protein
MTDGYEAKPRRWFHGCDRGSMEPACIDPVFVLYPEAAEIKGIGAFGTRKGVQF